MASVTAPKGIEEEENNMDDHHNVDIPVSKQGAGRTFLSVGNSELSKVSLGS